ncbi:MAG: BatD family protein [Gammaproteobacteria bacterium]|nr:BatD family protein [Gammaproteobacteria bacterium]
MHVLNKLTYIFVLFFVFAANSLAANITVQTDRSTLYANETFQLIFEATGSVDDDPDFSPLENNFSNLGESKSSNISIINGNYKKTATWTVTLMPLKAGVFTIPSIHFGKDLSPQIQLTIKPLDQNAATASGDFISELEVSSNQAYVNAQIIVTRRLLSNRRFASTPQFNELKTSGVDIIVEQLDEGKLFNTRRGNITYQVAEIRFAIFPQQSGKLHIEPSLAAARVNIGSNSNYYDPFRSNAQTKRALSRAIDLEVLPVPKQFKAQHWLVANSIQLLEHWPDNKTEYKVGEPITRNITVLADGVSFSQLPEITMPAIAGLKQYPDQPVTGDVKSSTGITSKYEQNIALIPARAGEFVLPAIEIPWWNSQTDKMEIAKLPAKHLVVVASGKPQATQATPAEPVQPAPELIPLTEPESRTSSQATSSFWIWLSLALAMGWLLTGLFWFFSSQKKSKQKKQPSTRHTDSLQQIDKILKQACDSGNAGACKDAFLQWGKTVFADQPPTSLGELADKAGEPLKTEINNLSAALYSNSPADWNSANLWRASRQTLSAIDDRKSSTTSELEPLYK